MALATAITLADALATPVNHTFIPLGPDAKNPRLWWFEDQTGPKSLGWNRISVEVVRAPVAVSSGDRSNRIKLGVYLPTLETIGTADSGLTPPDRVAFQLHSHVEFVQSERSVLQNRKDLRKYTANLCNDPQIVAAVEQLIPIY